MRGTPESINVSARVRPLSTAESSDPEVQTAVSCLETSVIVDPSVGKDRTRFFGARHAAPRPRSFPFDNVFHPHCSQLEVYEATTRHIVEACFQGVNGAILVYGATGGGKTHTMFGNTTSAPGLVFQAMQEIFEAKRRFELVDNKVVAVRCGFYEVYNERVFDLLAQRREELQLRDPGDASGHIEIPGLRHETPATSEEFMDLVERGRSNRFTAATGANAESSRSHAIVSVEIEVRDSATALGGVVAKLKLCDLAGSERAASTSNTGTRLREGANINKSLLVLGHVVQALAINSKGHLGQAAIPAAPHAATAAAAAVPGRAPRRVALAHVPYRGSKLTRLLQDCIGGNCFTSIIFCVSPSCKSVEETVNTMNFAMQAKMIQSAAKRNEFLVDKNAAARDRDRIIEGLRAELASLKDELYRSRTNLASSAAVAVTHCSDSASANDAASMFAAADSGLAAGEPRVRRSSEIRFKDAAVECNPIDCVLHHQDEIGQSADHIAAVFQRITTIRQQRDALVNKLSDVDVKRELELKRRVRVEKIKIADFLCSMKDGVDPSAPPPIGVAGAQQQISRYIAELQTIAERRDDIEAHINEIDRGTARLKQKLFGSLSAGGAHDGFKRHMLEVMLENLSHAISRSDAERMAAEFFQRCYCREQGEAELQRGLRMCVSVVKRALDQGRLEDDPELTRDACDALAYASIPEASTDDLLEQFKAALRDRRAVRVSFAPRQSVRQEFFDATSRLRIASGGGGGDNTAASGGKGIGSGGGSFHHHNTNHNHTGHTTQVARQQHPKAHATHRGQPYTGVDGHGGGNAFTRSMTYTGTGGTPGGAAVRRPTLGKGATSTASRFGSPPPSLSSNKSSPASMSSGGFGHPQSAWNCSGAATPAHRAAPAAGSAASHSGGASALKAGLSMPTQAFQRTLSLRPKSATAASLASANKENTACLR